MPHAPDQTPPADLRTQAPQYAGLFREPQYPDGIAFGDEDGDDETITP